MGMRRGCWWHCKWKSPRLKWHTPMMEDIQTTHCYSVSFSETSEKHFWKIRNISHTILQYLNSQLTRELFHEGNFHSNHYSKFKGTIKPFQPFTSFLFDMSFLHGVEIGHHPNCQGNGPIETVWMQIPKMSMKPFLEISHKDSFIQVTKNGQISHCWRNGSTERVVIHPPSKNLEI